MDSGVIGQVESGSEPVSDFTKEISIQHELFDELSQCLNVTEDIRMPDGRTAQFGQAAIEEISSVEETDIVDGGIDTYKKPRKIVKTTYFLHVPGNFVVASSGEGRFVFDLISREFSNSVDRIEFDIDSYIDEIYDEGINPWKVGFYDNVGNAENGVLHGENILSDSEFEEVFKSAKKNQVGLNHSYDGKEIKNFVTESGYVEIYQPSDFSTGEFATYIEDALLHHSYQP
ncbi:hypothetical protein [Halobiforma nitratireducens]|uniref:hypothetical protein n=1 Tax=Halobiforma nitratireducens TaxID=130048 RepID=UPI0012686C48|nr:hypothetical protein [Halobiforma nitratireducens]